MGKLSVIFAGSGSFGAPILEKLIKNDYFVIPFVVTGTDKPSGRGLKEVANPIKVAAKKNKLIVHQPVLIEDLKQKLMQVKPDFLLVVSYGEIIKEEILAIPKYGAINVHPSLLPKYRGASPIQEAILQGDSVTGVTCIKMSKKMDSGDIIASIKMPISPNDNFPTLSKKLSNLAAEHTQHVLRSFAEEPILIKQDENAASYCRKIKKEDGFIDVYRESADQIVRKILAYTPWPGCFIFWNGTRLKITQAKISEQKISTGEVHVENGRILLIGSQKGAILPRKVQPESKREMGIEEFLRGQKKLPGKI